MTKWIVPWRCCQINDYYLVEAATQNEAINRTKELVRADLNTTAIVHIGTVRKAIEPKWLRRAKRSKKPDRK